MRNGNDSSSSSNNDGDDNSNNGNKRNNNNNSNNNNTHNKQSNNHNNNCKKNAVLYNLDTWTTPEPPSYVGAFLYNNTATPLVRHHLARPVFVRNTKRVAVRWHRSSTAPAPAQIACTPTDTARREPNHAACSDRQTKNIPHQIFSIANLKGNSLYR